MSSTLLRPGSLQGTPHAASRHIQGCPAQSRRQHGAFPPFPLPQPLLGHRDAPPCCKRPPLLAQIAMDDHGFQARALAAALNEVVDCVVAPKAVHLELRGGVAGWVGGWVEWGD